MKKIYLSICILFLLNILYAEEVICPYCNKKFIPNKTEHTISSSEYKIVSPSVFRAIYSENEEKLDSKLCMENLMILQFFENGHMQMLTDNYLFIEIYVPNEDTLMELIDLTKRKINVYGRTIMKPGIIPKFQLDKYELCN